MPEPDSVSPRPTTFSAPVHLYHLKAVGQALRQALAEIGVPPEKIAPLLEHHCSARCAACGFVVSGAELEALFHNEPRDSPKLRRLQLGQCARNDCPSYFYDVQFQTAEGIDWEKLWQKSSEAQRTFPADGPTAKSRWTGFAHGLIHPYSRRELVLAATFAVVVVIFLFFHFRTPSWSSKPSPYRVDTNTIYRIAPESSRAE